MKKLTWQSSITNGNKTESSIAGPRVKFLARTNWLFACFIILFGKVCLIIQINNAAKRPILKESNKKDNPKIEITPEVVPTNTKDNKEPVIVTADNNDKVKLFVLILF